uniref:Uncharacterized protein n=1 Tax=Florenciella sp. virus SA2 TaxID=3240092 RepID=A0AB39JF26_9VIRU
MINLKNIIIFICICIFLHFVLYVFNVDFFEIFNVFDKKNNNNQVDLDDKIEIDNTILELENSIQELKDINI